MFYFTLNDITYQKRTANKKHINTYSREKRETDQINGRMPNKGRVQRSPISMMMKKKTKKQRSKFSSSNYFSFPYECRKNQSKLTQAQLIDKDISAFLPYTTIDIVCKWLTMGFVVVVVVVVWNERKMLENQIYLVLRNLHFIYYTWYDWMHKFSTV